MGKRSDFERIERDYYPTPYEAVVPLLPFVWGKFTEPCAGNGILVDHLTRNNLICEWASDIYPQRADIKKKDTLSPWNIPVTQFITNPPWNRDLLHPMIDHLMRIAPTWLLFDADWPHTIQSAPFMKYCSRIVSIGRVKWFPESDSVGKDNVCWYQFKLDHQGATAFTGRADKYDTQITLI